MTNGSGSPSNPTKSDKKDHDSDKGQGDPKKAASSGKNQDNK